MNRFVYTLCGLMVATACVVAQTSPVFVYKEGETLSYRITQATTIEEVLIDDQTMKPTKRTIITNLELVREWKVVKLDEGIATLEMQIKQMRWKQKVGDAEEDVFDSQKPDELNKNVMAKNIGKVLAVLKVDYNGDVTAVTESSIGAAHRFTTDLPFKISLKNSKVGLRRDYNIQLDPPHGTGEKYAAVQEYKPLEPQNGLNVYELNTQITLPPKLPEQIPLLPMLQNGTIYFHVPTGKYYGCRLKNDKTLENHQGEGTSYKYTSVYTEDYVPEKK